MEELQVLKRKLDAMLGEATNDDSSEFAQELGDALQGVVIKRIAQLKAKQDREERMKQLQEACEGSEEASVTLHALTDDCMICLNKLFKADDGVWGAVKLQCTGCSKSPILHVSCMMKLQDKQQKCPQCRQ
eukprot:11710-Heterococcus_DN1.PRE.1